VANYAPGSHVQVQLLVRGKPQTRSYSLVGLPRHGAYRIAVKRLDNGRGGSLAMWSLAPGDRLRMTVPQNHFPLDLNAPAYLLVAGGIGITPLVGMAQSLAERKANIRVVQAARVDAELAYSQELRTALGSDFRQFVAEQGQQVDFDLEIATLPRDGQLYVCGPASMLDAARKAWAKAGRPAAHLRYETFGSSGRFAPQAFQVRIPRQHIAITVPEDCSLLDAIEMAGVQTLSNCRRGECGLCAMDILAVDGEIDHRDVFLSDHEKAQNTRMCVCVSRVVGSVTLDSAYRPEN
jgi:vanillate O-demethylase ferredoxin subunit